VIQLIESINNKATDELICLFSDDIVIETPSPLPEGSTISGQDAAVGYIKELLHRYPSISLETEELIGFGHRCIFRWKAHVKIDTGVELKLRGLTLFLVRENKICEMLVYQKKPATER